MIGVVLKLGVLYAVVGDDLYPMRGQTVQREYRLRGLVYPEGRARREIASLYAGGLAEGSAMGRISRIGASGDEQNIPVVLFGHPRRRWPRVKAESRAVASRLLSKHWRAVEHVAAELEAEGRVSGRTVRSAILAR